MDVGGQRHGSHLVERSLDVPVEHQDRPPVGGAVDDPTREVPELDPGPDPQAPSRPHECLPPAVADGRRQQGLHRSPGLRLRPEETRPPHPGLVDDQEVSRPEQSGQLGEPVVGHVTGVEQPRGVARLHRPLGDALLGQFVAIVGGPHPPGWCHGSTVGHEVGGLPPGPRSRRLPRRSRSVDTPAARLRERDGPDARGAGRRSIRRPFDKVPRCRTPRGASPRS